MRKDDSKNLTIDDFHGMLNLARWDYCSVITSKTWKVIKFNSWHESHWIWFWPWKWQKSVNSHWKSVRVIKNIYLMNLCFFIAPEYTKLHKFFKWNPQTSFLQLHACSDLRSSLGVSTPKIMGEIFQFGYNKKYKFIILIFSMTFTDFQWLFTDFCQFYRPTSNSITIQVIS